MWIERAILPELRQLLKEYPVVTLLGSRQAGKTTLARQFLREFGYANLEDPETREIAIADPRTFLAGLPERAIIDEIQRAPDLLSHIQVEVDLLIPDGRQLKTIEIKSASTFRMERLKNLQRFRAIASNVAACYLVYNGNQKTLSDNVTALNFHEIEKIFRKFCKRRHSGL